MNLGFRKITLTISQRDRASTIIHDPKMWENILAWLYLKNLLYLFHRSIIYWAKIPTAWAMWWALATATPCMCTIEHHQFQATSIPKDAHQDSSTSKPAHPTHTCWWVPWWAALMPKTVSLISDPTIISLSPPSLGLPSLLLHLFPSLAVTLALSTRTPSSLPYLLSLHLHPLHPHLGRLNPNHHYCFPFFSFPYSFLIISYSKTIMLLQFHFILVEIPIHCYLYESWNMMFTKHTKHIQNSIIYYMAKRTLSCVLSGEYPMPLAPLFTEIFTLL